MRGFLNASKISSDALEREVAAGYEVGCTKGDNDACMGQLKTLLDDGESPAAFKKGRDILIAPCERGNGDACMTVQLLGLFLDEDGNPREPESMQSLMKSQLPQIEKNCERAGGELGNEICPDMLDMFLDGDNEQFGITGPVPQRAYKTFAARCDNGITSSCESLLKLASNKVPPTKGQLIKANKKLCELSPYEEGCDLCAKHDGKGPVASDPKDQMCRERLAWKERLDCDEGKEDRCEVLASMYHTGDGVSKSLSSSIDYYRLACDSALKSSCSTLEMMCRTSKELDGDERCMQSLIHTDVFYGTEWQFRQTGSAKILGEGGGSSQENVGKVSVSGQASAGGGISLKRGSLDADLVVSIVLDRARQAAIRLVVSELKRAGKDEFLPIYLEDLLTQASLLLADQSSMRREKFQDLGMTVVRAFVASNLTKTLFSNSKALLAHKGWAQWAAEAKVTWRPEKFGKQDLVKLRGYLTDWVYYALADTPLFGRATGDKVRIPACPFKGKSTKVACALLLNKDDLPNVKRLATLLRVEDMLQGLSLAKALREEGSIDLRRFIEAIGRSQTIANLKSTPGLNLQQWKKEVADATETRLRDLRLQLDAAQMAFGDGWRRVADSSDVRKMRENALHVVGENSPYLALLDAENVREARAILRMAKEIEAKFKKVEALEAKLASAGGLSLGGGTDVSAIEIELSAAQKVLGKAGQVLRSTIREWDDADALRKKIAKLQKDLDETRPLMLEFRRSLVEIETMLRRYKPPRVAGADVTIEVESKFEISHVPLHALPDLRKHFQDVATNLVMIDKQLGQVFPGSARPKLKFAVSAVVRLLGFFDLMERVARTARLNQTCGDVIEALRLLGSVNEHDFSAPLFDVMDPVLQAIKTHEPMDVDQLFTVISKVRLDSLITSLAKDVEKPCEKNEKGFECWTVKIIHSLQEAVQRDGPSIRIDGGAFAKRLASQDDDFRRKHKWRTYFHLTVGLGGLMSEQYQSTGMSGSENRVVPLVGEQIGFGWASPTFFNDALTFKFGGYGSGILYRATLDSAESNAIMVSPFVALDFFDLVELYAGPMMLFYPPQDDQGAAVRFGAAAGLTVPLSAYLEKL